MKIKSAGRVLTTDSVVLGRILLGFLFCRRKRKKEEVFRGVECTKKSFII